MDARRRCLPGAVVLVFVTAVMIALLPFCAGEGKVNYAVKNSSRIVETQIGTGSSKYQNAVGPVTGPR